MHTEDTPQLSCAVTHKCTSLSPFAAHAHKLHMLTKNDTPDITSAAHTFFHYYFYTLGVCVNNSSFLTKDEGTGSLGVVAGYPRTLQLAGPA